LGPEPAPKWNAAAAIAGAGFGVDHGWGAWEGGTGSNVPQQPFGYGGDFVPREEYQQLVQHVGGIKTTLQQTNTNIDMLSHNLQALTTFWPSARQFGIAPSSCSGQPPQYQWPDSQHGHSDDME
jgi:hypothetical protein